MTKNHRHLFFKKNRLFGAFILFFLSFSFVNDCFSKDGIVLSKPIISGLERIDEATVLKYFENLKNDKSLPHNLEKIRKNLLETEYFSSVNINLKNQTISLEVTENPIVYETKFIGNKKIDEEALISETTLKKRSIFSQSKLQSDIKRINEIYVKSGRFLSKIEPKIIKKDQNRIELIYEIEEGPKAKIGEIYFIGNNAFSDRELSERISTKKSIWWKFLSSSDMYDSDRIEFDKELLRRYYNNNGFADFTTISSMAQINRNKDNFFITFLVEEGIKYKIGEINIINHVEGFEAEILNEKLLFKSGAIYNAEAIEKTIDAMTEIMSEKSYAFANIEPILKRNQDKKIIDIDFIINETPRIFIDKIKIFGNTRTLDEVIRRELRIREGDPYNINKINRSKQRIENLGYFDKVDFNTKKIGETDLVDLEITVNEKRTGELNLGLGYSKLDGFNVNTGIRENNLFGTGQKLGFNIQKSFANLSADVNYSKPYFLGRPIDVGFEIFRINSAKRNTRVFEIDNSGFKLNASYSITEFLDHLISYSYNAQNIGNITQGSSLATQMTQGNYIYSSIENSLFYDRTDNRIDPRKGYFFSISQTYTGIGGDIHNLKHQGRASYFIPTINRDIILKLMTRGGVVQGIGEDVNIQNNFFLGGNDIRGFAFYGIGPRVQSSKSINNNEAVGGKIYYVGTLELRFPVGLPRELGINGALFWDNGVIKGVDKSIKQRAEIADSGKLRSSVGFSVFWASPMGPIRLDFAKILQKTKYDKSQTFNINFGTNLF
ncbi:MAG: outer membrane protein assembly factor BamA [Proteobacteria bacterium]|nr:outer membrane protein assembly factor BamA [Pseudomonadota bacterium]NCA28087.1 outer membrane protein assembly factor BamA [Pseudomonadota bacterium]